MTVEETLLQMKKDKIEPEIAKASWRDLPSTEISQALSKLLNLGFRLPLDIGQAMGIKAKEGTSEKMSFLVFRQEFLGHVHFVCFVTDGPETFVVPEDFSKNVWNGSGVAYRKGLN